MESRESLPFKQLDLFHEDPEILRFRARWSCYLLNLDRYQASGESNIYGLLFPLQSREPELQSSRFKLSNKNSRTLR